MYWLNGASCALDARVIKVREHFTVEVAFEVPSGAACGLFGVSGAGKSTILNCIAGTEQPDRGHVRLGNLTLFPPSLPIYLRPIGYLTQEPNLFPHLNVGENIGFGMARGNGAVDQAWIAELCDRLQIDSIWRAPSYAISGGQARRVALARMLARKPKLVLLDEPFTGLDRHLLRELLEALAHWHKALGFTMLVVDHEAEVLERLCPQTIAIEDGRIVAHASWKELRANPATPRLAQLLAPL
jgi:ABC-type sulfate/molybdate transport systems ATPase subunit